MTDRYDVVVVGGGAAGLAAAVTLGRSLRSVLTEPRNALVKQYARLMEMDNIELSFEPAALSAIAHQAMSRKSGARGLRAIIEGVLMDAMYELPGKDGIEKCVITEDAVTKGEKPTLVEGETHKRHRAPAKPKVAAEPSVS